MLATKRRHTPPRRSMQHAPRKQGRGLALLDHVDAGVGGALRQPAAPLAGRIQIQSAHPASAMP